MFKRAKRKVPGLNTSSTADISFMLLILFLVTTSMEVDEGLERTLPPIEKMQKETQSMVDERLVLRFHIFNDNKLRLNNKPITLATIRKTVENFVAVKVNSTSFRFRQTEKLPIILIFRFKTRSLQRITI